MAIKTEKETEKQLDNNNSDFYVPDTMPRRDVELREHNVIDYMDGVVDKDEYMDDAPNELSASTGNFAKKFLILIGIIAIIAAVFWGVNYIPNMLTSARRSAQTTAIVTDVNANPDGKGMLVTFEVYDKDENGKTVATAYTTVTDEMSLRENQEIVIAYNPNDILDMEIIRVNLMAGN